MPRRGLEYLLTAWPSIRKCIPNATLEVYYGFTELDRTEAAQDPSVKRWMDIMLSALSTTEGVIYRGMVGHSELAKALSRSGFYLYPTAYPETSCISLMKAQACGAVPITSRLDTLPPPPYPHPHLIRAPTDVPHFPSMSTHPLPHNRTPQVCGFCDSRDSRQVRSWPSHASRAGRTDEGRAAAAFVCQGVGRTGMPCCRGSWR